MTDLERWIRSIPDWPEPGVTFRDLTPIFGDAAAFRTLVDDLAGAAAASGEGIDAILGIEARGFILGAPVALALGVGFVPIRKAGKLPGDVRAVTYDLEYGTATVEMQVDAVQPGARVVLIDDVLATGGTLEAARELATQSEANVLGAVVAVELTALDGRDRLADLPLTTLLTY